MVQLRDFQEEGIEGLRVGFAAGHRTQILYGPTGMGKCLGHGTPILMADGRGLRQQWLASVQATLLRIGFGVLDTGFGLMIVRVSRSGAAS